MWASGTLHPSVDLGSDLGRRGTEDVRSAPFQWYQSTLPESTVEADMGATGGVDDLRTMLQAFQDQLTALGQQVREGQQAGVAFHEELRRVLQVAQTAQETARTAVLLTQGHEQQQPQQQHQQPEAAQLPPHERMGPPAAGPRAPKPKSPEEFDPARKRDVDTWLFQVDLYYLMFPEMTDAAKVLNCSTYLRGSAQTWWRHFASQHDRLHALTWEEFKEAFRSRWQIVIQSEWPATRSQLSDSSGRSRTSPRGSST